MSHVLTLIAPAGKAPLLEAHPDAARRALDRAGAACGAPDWLSPSEACDIPFSGDPSRAREEVGAALAGLPIDFAVLPAADRRKRLLLADMDSTLIEQECIDELAMLTGVGKKVAAITERAMRGEIAFEPALRERVALLAGLKADVVGQLLAERITLMPGGRRLVATMRAHGAFTALVSGGFTAFAEPVGARFGFDEVRANVLLAEGGRLTGRVAEPVLGRDAKVEALRDLAVRLRIEPCDAIAVGDGANDLGMIRLAGLGVAFRAKPAVRAEADAAIDFGDLSALLFLQGYRRDEFVD